MRYALGAIRRPSAWTWAVAVTVALAASGCGPAPIGSSSPSAVVSDAVPTGWVRIDLGDPHIVLSFPPGWTSIPVQSMRAQLSKSLETATGDVAVNYRWAVEQIDGGRLRLIIAGPSSIAGVTTSMSVLVDARDPSLEAAVDRQIADTISHSGGELVGRVDRLLAIGPATRLTWKQAPTGGAVPSQTFDYVVRLSDGRTVTLNATSVAQDSGFEAYIDRIVGTFTIPPG